MKIEANLFTFLTPFFLLVAVVYGFMTEWHEWVGFICLILTAGLVGMVGVYLGRLSRRIDARPSDDPEGEIAQGAGPYGFFSPWSWWPIVLAGAAAVAFLGVAIGWWIFGVGVVLGVIALVGWVLEYSRGIHAH
jgi:phosphoglycerol transferase MdoB-like AlkP superfamily enzyme